MTQHNCPAPSPATFEKQQFSELQKLSINKKEKDKKEGLVVEKLW